MVHRLRTRGSGPLLAALVAVAALFGVGATDPPSVHACSCVVARTIAEAADPNDVIVAGTVGASEPRGVRFAVAEWFWGANPAPVVWLDQRSFGLGAGDCSIRQPAAGTHLLLVGFRTRAADALRTGLCAPSADLGTAEGQRQLADVRRAFGGGIAPAAPPLEDIPPEVAGAADDARSRALALTVAAIVAAVTATFLVVAAAARRRRAGR